jgi:hypothetical protein
MADAKIASGAEDFSHLLGTSSQGDCDHEVFKDGSVVFITHTLSAKMVEEWCRRVRVSLPEGTRLDWHFVGGRAVFKALGDIDEAKAALSLLRPVHDAMFFCAMRELESFSDEWIQRCINGVWNYNCAREAGIEP